MSFYNFGFGEKLLDGIDALGYETTTPVQEKTIPLIIEGGDLIVSAQTGTGKTAAFLLPLIHKITTGKKGNHIKAMIVVPTRELAIQIDQNMEGLSYFTPVSSIAIYGGRDGISFSKEKQVLTDGVDVVICTPGKMISHLNMGYTDMNNLEYLILDEADRMLDIGFHDDIMRIVSFLPEKRQSLLFSATMPQKIVLLAKKVLRDPSHVNIALAKPPEQIVQMAYMVYEDQKIRLVKHLLSDDNNKRVIVFCSTKSSTKQLSRDLKKAKFSAEDIHSDLDQNTREEVLAKFRNKKLQVLVATDILSRGIDIDNIDLVINYDIPNDGEDYVHRIGRTARAESKGTAVTFVTKKEQSKFAEIEKLLEKEVPKAKVPEEFGEAPSYNPGTGRPSNGNKNFRGKRNFKGGNNRKKR